MFSTCTEIFFDKHFTTWMCKVNTVVYCFYNHQITFFFKFSKNLATSISELLDIFNKCFLSSKSISCTIQYVLQKRNRLCLNFDISIEKRPSWSTMLISRNTWFKTEPWGMVDWDEIYAAAKPAFHVLMVPLPYIILQTFLKKNWEIL